MVVVDQRVHMHDEVREVEPEPVVAGTKHTVLVDDMGDNAMNELAVADRREFQAIPLRELTRLRRSLGTAGQERPVGSRPCCSP